MDDLILDAAQAASDDPAAARVKVDAYKWRAAKLAPKRYGDAMLHKHGDAEGEKIPMDETSKFTRLAAIVATLKGALDDTAD
jgi:hypothetical protein